MANADGGGINAWREEVEMRTMTKNRVQHQLMPLTYKKFFSEDTGRKNC
jgi:hypothetical protein